MGNMRTEMSLTLIMVIVVVITILFFKDGVQQSYDMATMTSTTDTKKTGHNTETKSTRHTTDTGHLISDTDRALFEPSHAYEKTRRKIRKGAEEMWYYIRAQFKQLQNSTGDTDSKERIAEILELGEDQHRSLMTDIYNLSQVDCYSSWRKQELQGLSDIVQQRLFYLQNPKDCNIAKKIVCNFKVECGFGCQIHQLAICMAMAYGSERTLILHSKGWSYAKEGWDKFFLPLSETCLDDRGNTTGKWGDPGSNENTQVLEFPTIHTLPMDARPDFLPLAIPEDLSQRLTRVHSNPSVWWMGQILQFIKRPRPIIQDYIKNKTVALGFTGPIVGIQVRRTDKIWTEASFHGIEEYMVHAEEFYRRLERQQEVPVRRVYLASDVPSLLEEARTKYPNYVFISDKDITKTAEMSTRFTEIGLMGLLVDIHLLSQSDFLVCTFSSNICRLAYEMMHAHREDAAFRTISVDRKYFYYGQNPREMTVLYEHEPRNTDEIKLRQGDTVWLAEGRNQRDGYSGGTNMGQEAKYDSPTKVEDNIYHGGIYPSYKVEDKIKAVKMPTYEGAENFHL